MKELLLTLTMMNASDAASTHVALNRVGGREISLPTQNPYVIDSLIAADTASEVLLLKRLHQRHPKLAKGFALTAIVIRSGIVVHNVYELRK